MSYYQLKYKDFNVTKPTLLTKDIDYTSEETKYKEIFNYINNRDIESIYELNGDYVKHFETFGSLIIHAIGTIDNELDIDSILKIIEKLKKDGVPLDVVDNQGNDPFMHFVQKDILFYNHICDDEKLSKFPIEFKNNSGETYLWRLLKNFNVIKKYKKKDDNFYRWIKFRTINDDPVEYKFSKKFFNKLLNQAFIPVKDVYPIELLVNCPDAFHKMHEKMVGFELFNKKEFIKKLKKRRNIMYGAGKFTEKIDSIEKAYEGLFVCIEKKSDTYYIDKFNDIKSGIENYIFEKIKNYEYKILLDIDIDISDSGAIEYKEDDNESKSTNKISAITTNKKGAIPTKKIGAIATHEIGAIATKKIGAIATKKIGAIAINDSVKNK